MPYYFSGSSIKFQGHTGWKIDDLNPIWVRLLGRSQLSNSSDLPCFWLSSWKYRFRWWLDIEKATSHCLNQCWCSSNFISKTPLGNKESWSSLHMWTSPSFTELTTNLPSALASKNANLLSFRVHDVLESEKYMVLSFAISRSFKNIERLFSTATSGEYNCMTRPVSTSTLKSPK